MKLSYLISCHNETDTLFHLVSLLCETIEKSEDEVVILDDFSDPSKTQDFIQDLCAFHNTKYGGRVKKIQHHLDNDYGAHKDWGGRQCTGDYIFQIDGDELPSEYIIGENLHTIIESNLNVELIFVPRINDFKGVQQHHAAQWGWRLSESPSLHRPIVNWPDYQGRIYKNKPGVIKWDRRLHEKIEGHKEYSFLPAEEEYALLHDKTIEKQIETNLKYNQKFSQQENQGHQVT